MHCIQQRFSVNVVVPCQGGLGIPKKPELRGQDTFRGSIIHTAEWDTSYDVKNRRVAVLGTGASGILTTPAIAPQVRCVKMGHSFNKVRYRICTLAKVLSGEKFSSL